MTIDKHEGMVVTFYDRNDSTGDVDITNYRLSCNCYHVLIKNTKSGEEVFARGDYKGEKGLGEDWMDERHMKLINALKSVEDAIEEITGHGQYRVVKV